MSHCVKCEILFYANDSCLVWQHKDINEIENRLNEDFCNICDWFVDNKLNITLMRIRKINTFSKLKRENIKKLKI